MLAYSSIAHAGYLLLGVAALFAPAASLGTERVGVLGATAAVGRSCAAASPREVLQGAALLPAGATPSPRWAPSACSRRSSAARTRPSGNTWDLERFGGLAQRQPGWAVAMAAFMLSLGGIPPTVGFMGKLLLFRAAVDAGLLGPDGAWACSPARRASTTTCAWWFTCTCGPSPDGVTVPERQWTTEVALVVSVAGVVVLGLLPNLLGDWLSRAGLLFGG